MSVMKCCRCICVVLQVVFGDGGVLEGMTVGKGYIDTSTVDVETSQRMSKVGKVEPQSAVSRPTTFSFD